MFFFNQSNKNRISFAEYSLSWNFKTSQEWHASSLLQIIDFMKVFIHEHK